MACRPAARQIGRILDEIITNACGFEQDGLDTLGTDTEPVALFTVAMKARRMLAEWLAVP